MALFRSHLGAGICPKEAFAAGLFCFSKTRIRLLQSTDTLKTDEYLAKLNELQKEADEAIHEKTRKSERKLMNVALINQQQKVLL
jgi:hypothetical protein